MRTLFVIAGHQRCTSLFLARQRINHPSTHNNEERHPLTTKERPQEAGFFTQKIPFTLLRSKSKP
jgi:hypothetical protein